MKHCGATPLQKGTLEERGQATVEFGLICTAILLFLVGTIDLGRAIYYYDVLANAARDGARQASVTDPSAWTIDGNTPGSYTTTLPYAGTPTIAGATADQATGLDLSQLQLTIDAPMGTAAGLNLPITVLAQYDYEPVATTLLGIGPITIEAQSTMHLR